LILLISNIPSTLLWIPDYAYELTGVGIPWTISSNNDWFSLASDLLLPLMFLGILAGRSLTLRQEKHYLKMHDVVTGLPNRESLQQIKINQHSIGFDLVVLAVNVKRFREINEALGIKIGDQLLAEVGRRLSSVGAEHIARLHTDQFCLLTTDSQLANVLEKLHQVFSYPAQVNGQIVDLALAIGAARERELTAASSDDLSVTNLLRNAEIALDVARTYRLDWVEYDKVLEVGRQGDLGLMSGISQAISNNEFRLYLQPKIRMADGGMVSAEALIRWEHPTRGLIAPEHFIPFAEKTGCIRMITKWVLSEAMDIVAMLRANGTPIQLGVNLSAFDLDDTALLKLLEQLLIEHRANPADIRFEITEHSAMNNPIAALEVMHGLCNLGFSISIDDFGTGYSSLAYLKQLPLDQIKIDQSFVRDITSDPNDAVMVKTIIDLAKNFHLNVIAEGVENEEQLNFLKSHGCEAYQGYLFSRPIYIDQFEELLSAASAPQLFE
jgi:diguanylate cyclase (GGDEF)-like protein